jgi:hypothetical protein
MSCFEDLMQFRDEVDRAERNILLRGRGYRLKCRSRAKKESQEGLP